MSYGNSPAATFACESGRSAPEPSEANWEISFVPPLPVTYTNGAPGGEAAGAGAPATVHPAASPQAVTASPAARPVRSLRLTGPRFLAPGIGTVPRRPAGFPPMPDPIRLAD